ncbi:MAG: DUF1844 domain-containing protein [Candidatus Aminicenantes bacterium]|nr:DUF1844 domain-containing protein [Candidatus Aminicenantes bacterium]NIM81903.1 DUF1844 domain-containing protein [Candidatus Aminicenantes bacterium]NIN21280.1 DUF1844 domain-containing protein [Candidatus Aminicenantes bacterium]NIN45101.1 DUF1844 domain-containing protein [Candidatus Aminicenantes bacterium]NIN87918.1 DUF1844 domain-containing protein [Candidatus Aminicenantes bacterium]
MIILFGIECKLENKMEIDIKSIIVLLATQAMINMGEIQDPLTQEAKNDLEGASVFMQLLDVLELKTKGNLTPQEEAFLVEVKDNLDQVYNKKLNAGN